MNLRVLTIDRIGKNRKIVNMPVTYLNKKKIKGDIKIEN